MYTLSRFTAFISLLCGALLCALSASAQERNLVPAPTSMIGPAAQRVALVVGNAAYREAPLANPVNDARDMAKALSNLGFAVTLTENANLRELKQSLRDFAGRIKQGGVGLFYFAGHGVQSKGRNYLIPVGADIQQEYELEDQALDANLVLAAMEEAQNPVNIVILDACRNNPFARSFRSASRGLAQMDAAKGTLIAYSTAPGSVAADGNDGNGIYTKYLLRNLSSGDSDIAKVFSRVRTSVVQATGGQQTPWESTSLIGDFYFNPAQAATAGSPVSPEPAQISPLALEISFWQSAERSNRKSDLESYLRKYPDGQFVDLAKSRIAVLSQPAGPATPGTAKGPPATVTFFRNGGFIGSSVDYAVLAEGRELGTLSNSAYFTAQLPPGARALSAEGASVSIQRTYDLEPGGTYFIQVNYSLTGGLTLRMVKEAEAREEMKSLREVGIASKRPY